MPYEVQNYIWLYGYGTPHLQFTRNVRMPAHRQPFIPVSSDNSSTLTFAKNTTKEGLELELMRREFTSCLADIEPDSCKTPKQMRWAISNAN